VSHCRRIESGGSCYLDSIDGCNRGGSYRVLVKHFVHAEHPTSGSVSLFEYCQRLRTQRAAPCGRSSVRLVVLAPELSHLQRTIFIGVSTGARAGINRTRWRASRWKLRPEGLNGVLLVSSRNRGDTLVKKQLIRAETRGEFELEPADCFTKYFLFYRAAIWMSHLACKISFVPYRSLLQPRPMH